MQVVFAIYFKAMCYVVLLCLFQTHRFDLNIIAKIFSYHYNGHYLIFFNKIGLLSIIISYGGSTTIQSIAINLKKSGHVILNR